MITDILFKFLLLAFSFSILCSCWDIKTGKPVHSVAPGVWRGNFMLNDQSVPVMFEVSDHKLMNLTFKTGQNELRADSLRMFGDTLFAHFYKTNTMLKVVCQIDQMDGFLYDNSGDEYPIAFAGQNAILHRFPAVRNKPLANLTGDWEMKANVSKDSTIYARVRFVAKENYIEGVLFMNDEFSIALEGTVQNDLLYLSGFDGKNVCLLNATILNNKTLSKGSLILNNKNFFWEATASAGLTD